MGSHERTLRTVHILLHILNSPAYQQQFSIFYTYIRETSSKFAEISEKLLWCSFSVSQIPITTRGCRFNPILHSWFRDSCFTCDGSLTIQVLPLLFNRYGNLAILEFSSKWVKVLLPYTGEGGLHCSGGGWGGGCSLMIHSAGSVTILKV